MIYMPGKQRQKRCQGQYNLCFVLFFVFLMDNANAVKDSDEQMHL